MKKELIRIIICMLLVGSVLPVTGTIITNYRTSLSSQGGITLYVGGDGEGNYTKIQDAIDNASDDDTVFVFDDSSPYYELVVIDKSISLLGENRYTTIIDGQEKFGGEYGIISLKTDDVIVQGFTIQNSSLEGSHMGEYHYGININNSNNNIIKDNIIIDNYIGIKLGCYNPRIYTYNNIIENNIIEYNIRDGLYIHNAYNSIISNNSISFNGQDGISIPWYKSSNNIITHNNISSNNEEGIRVTGNNNIIKSNNIVNHKTGIFILYSIKNQISKNNIYNNAKNIDIHVALIGLFFGHMWSNKWNGNYWGKTQIFPKMIIGKFHYDDYNDIFRIPLITFDWNPAKEPYDIGI